MTTSFTTPGVYVPRDGIMPNFNFDYLNKPNPFIASYAIMFILLILATCVSLIFFIYSLKVTDFELLPKHKTSVEILMANNSYAMSGKENGSDPCISNKTIETGSSTDTQLNTVTQNIPDKSSIPSTSTSSDSLNQDNFCLRFSNSIAFRMEEGYFKFGIVIGKHPKVTIVLSLLIVCK